VIDPSNLDSRYHKKGEDLDLTGNALLLNDYVKLEMETNTIARLYRRDIADYAHLKLNILYCIQLLARGLDFDIRPLANTNNARVDFDGYAYNGSWSALTCAQLKSRLTGGADVANFTIPRAGNISQ